MLKRLWRTLLYLLCIVQFIRFWLLPARDGLWIDEAGTYWTIAGGWEELWVRTGFHPNSRLYGLLLLPWTKLAGTSEIALRLPSLVAALGALAVIGAFLRRELGDGIALPLVALGIASPELSFFAIDARPYAIALLFFAVSIVAVVRLQRELTWRWAVLWILSAGLLVHLQPVVSLALSGQFLWLVWRMEWRSLTAGKAAAWAAIVAVWALVAAPEIVRLFPIVVGSNPSSMPARPTAQSIARAALPVSILGPAVLAAGALLLLRQWRTVRIDGRARELALLGISIVAATALVCGLYSAFTWRSLLLTRYTIGVYLGCFLVLGVLLARWTGAKGRLWFALVYSGSTLALSVWRQGPVPIHTDADWRGALARVREWQRERPLPLLLQTGFVEGGYGRLLGDPQWGPFLCAPALYYPHSGPTYLIPYRSSRKSDAYREVLYKRVEGQRFAALVYESPGGTSDEVIRLSARHGPPRLLGRFRRLGVYAFGPP